MPSSQPPLGAIHPRLRRLISPYDHGLKLAGRVIHARRNADVVRDLDARGWVPGLTNAAMDRHFAGEETSYFTADGRVATPEVLLMIDVDCHRSGTYRAAVAFAEHLRDDHFPGLYFERSTNGNGIHAYLVLDKRGFGDVRTHSLFGMLDRALKGIHSDWQSKHPDQVVELVEVKGHPPRIDRDRSGKVANYTSGQLAKLPREIVDRWDEFRRTTKIDERRVSDLHRRWMVRVENRTRAKVGVQGGDRSANSNSGSTSGHVVARDALDRFDSYRALARRLLPGALRTCGREIATAEDLAILLLILEACTLRMNADGSMPTARIMENWGTLREDGEVSRPFNPKRYAAMRDFLSREGLLDWEDESYLPFPMSAEGKGRAARWRASEMLMEMIGQEKEDVEFQAVIQEPVGDGWESGRRERGEHLYGDNHDPHLYRPREGDSFEGNTPRQPHKSTLGIGEEDRFQGNYSRWLRELTLDDYPRPVLRVSSRWRMAA